jgi:hypothetical protein
VKSRLPKSAILSYRTVHGHGLVAKTVPSHASTLPSAVMDLKTVTTEVTNQQL